MVRKVVSFVCNLISKNTENVDCNEIEAWNSTTRGRREHFSILASWSWWWIWYEKLFWSCVTWYLKKRSKSKNPTPYLTIKRIFCRNRFLRLWKPLWQGPEGKICKKIDPNGTNGTRTNGARTKWGPDWMGPGQNGTRTEWDPDTWGKNKKGLRTDTDSTKILTKVGHGPCPLNPKARVRAWVCKEQVSVSIGPRGCEGMTWKSC